MTLLPGGLWLCSQLGRPAESTHRQRNRPPGPARATPPVAIPVQAICEVRSPLAPAVPDFALAAQGGYSRGAPTTPRRFGRSLPLGYTRLDVLQLDRLG